MNDMIHPATARNGGDSSSEEIVALEILQQSEMELAILRTVLDGVIVIDARGTIQCFNPAASRIFGYTPAEVLGRNVRMLMPDPYHREHDSYLSNYIGTGERKVIGIGREVAGKRKDGTIFPMELGVNEMRVEGRHSFVGTIRDISERKDNERKIDEYIAALQKSNQALDEFAYIASHDLKEPLRGLSNNASFLKEDMADRLDEDATRRIDRIIFLAERLEQLVNDLLYFSRLGRQELAIQATDLNEVITEIAEVIEATPHEGEVFIQVPEPLPTIVCDRPRITELFRNLISNAVKYNDNAEKRIEIGWKPGALAPVFHVRDNGIGIDSRFHEEIFRIFKRLNSEDDDRKGTGVGLTFVRKIVERHGGAIWLESAPGAGTTFFFSLQQPE